MNDGRLVDLCVTGLSPIQREVSRILSDLHRVGFEVVIGAEIGSSLEWRAC